MAFHFPIMPRLFMAVRMEDRFPILDILEQSLNIPPTCQWAMFLRNHDELTLEMVTDQERDYMYKAYAQDPRARINVGIRRRLAPLLNNNRRVIELMNSLLLSLPGSPILYYGDEIGMGDNIFLGDRNGVRTPMHWDGDRNAGFSRADPSRLYSPIIMDPGYNYEAINVENSLRRDDSFLKWIRRAIKTREKSKCFSRGDIRFFGQRNKRVLCYLRTTNGETVLVANNLSRHAQYVELDLRNYAGQYPVDLFGGTEFPQVGELPYLLTMGPYGFYWLRFEKRPGA
jgi:maltose alpha-D-glucosyltransferase/alpha-amylase